MVGFVEDSQFGMGIEVKLRLPNSKAHQNLISLLSPFHVKTQHQRSIFYDGAAGELTSRKANLFLRFFDNASPRPACFVCMKTKPVIRAGVSRVEQEVEPVEYDVGFGCVEDPAAFGEYLNSSTVVRRAKEEFGVEKFVVLGGYRNVRNVFEWDGMKLEVDETVFDFGTCYEIECESAEPEKVKAVIEGFLNENRIEYSYSEMSKFSIFRSGKLPYVSSSDETVI